MAQRTSPELRELQELWVAAVVHGDFERRCFTEKPQPCWFGENVPGIDSCEGKIEGAHWLKQQRIRNSNVGYFKTIGEGEGPGCCRWDPMVLWVCIWDPRNGVPACNKHHTRFDSGRMPTLVVWRHEVPAMVEAFARDWGLETQLADRNPTMNTGGI